jgi:signal transduction histidine kinase
VSSDYIYVKIFKRIPQVDIEMLFPNTKVAFRPFDKLKLMVTAGGGTVAGVAGTATKLLAATSPFTLAFGVFGLSALIFRQAMKFFHTRNHYMMVLAQNLYFCSLANNRGALTLIADGAEEEDVKEVVEKRLLILEPKVGGAKMQLFFEKGEALPPVRLDLHQIQQVLINLILNAIQAMEKGGSLRIQTFERSGGVGVAVKDTGIGIPKANLKKIFDPFFTTKSEGTGLGLSISLKILEKHGATLEAASKEGKGSTFTIHLPRGNKE